MNNGLATAAAARAFIRDVALVHNDVTFISEAASSDSTISLTQQTFGGSKGHRIFGCGSTTRTTGSRLGTGTLAVVKSTIAAKPGDGLVYKKADGKRWRSPSRYPTDRST